MPDNIGMLWYDDSLNESKNKKTFLKSEREKILEAIAYYKEKYGINASEVHININSSFSVKKDVIEGITVKKMKGIIEHHFWII